MRSFQVECSFCGAKVGPDAAGICDECIALAHRPSFTPDWPVGSVCRIHDPGAVWDRGDLVQIVGYHAVWGQTATDEVCWPIVRGSGEDRIINPARLRLTVRSATVADSRQLPLL